jgi:hypothetical protein
MWLGSLFSEVHTMWTKVKRQDPYRRESGRIQQREEVAPND